MFDGSIGTTPAGFNMVLDSTGIAGGTSVNISSCTFEVPLS
jgi:hypothetical protein